VDSYTNLFASFLPSRFTVDNQARLPISGTTAPTLKSGDTVLNMNTAVTDDFLSRTGAISTIFVRDGDDFVRITTSTQKRGRLARHRHQTGSRQPAFAPVSGNKSFSGLAVLFGKQYITQYKPVTDASGSVIAILFVGIDISKEFAQMQKRILDKRIGDSGHFVVLSKAGATAGAYLVHPTLAGQKPDWSGDALQQVLKNDSGRLEYDDNSLSGDD
ncbi:methyl-accepting chemotaxis protein, partial [Pseudomonas syringae pv. actinidiae]|nr:methyl-accepting chemotaxis protein [Pseudomonas syringae pv. actinidiae]